MKLSALKRAELPDRCRRHYWKRFCCLCRFCPSEVYLTIQGRVTDNRGLAVAIGFLSQNSTFLFVWYCFMEEYRDIVMEIRDNSRVKSFTVLKSRIVAISQILDKIDFRWLYWINIYQNRSAPKSTRWKINTVPSGSYF